MPDKPSDATPGGALPAFEPVDVWTIAPPPTDSGTGDEVLPDGRRTAPPAGEEMPADRGRRRGRAPRNDWRLGGRTVLRWREGLLAFALISLGAGVVAGALVGQVWPSTWAPIVATALIWIGMLVPVAWAFARSRPIGLLRFGALDPVYALAFGVVLRAAQGWLDGFDGSPATFPAFSRVNGAISTATLLNEALAPVLVAPAIEEFFFRAVILVATYCVLRRRFGKVAAGVCAVVSSTALFVIVHAILQPGGVVGVIAVTLLGLVSGLLVILTGRIWGAVLTHAVFNATFVLLAAIGSAVG